MSRTTDGTDRLGVLLAIPEGLPPLRIGALPIPVRLLRQFRKAGAGPPAVLVFSNWHRARAWQRTAAEEGAVAVTTKELPGVMASPRVRGWIYAPGDLVMSGEGLEEALRRAPANSQAILPDGHPAGWSIAPPSGDGAIAWVRAMCEGKPVDPLTAATIPLPHQTVLGRAVDAATAERLDDAVMRGLAREEDPNFTRLSGRRISRRISRRLAARGVMPNAVTAAAVVLGLAAATMILQGGYVWTVAGACVLALSRILDDCDGEVARLTFRQSTFGARFDVTGDIVVYTAVFLALASGLHRLDPAGRYLWALALLLFGAAITTVLVLGFVTGSRLPEESRLLRLMERGASGDFAYLLLLFALVGRAQWFLWAAAVGSQVYWVTLGVAVLLSRRKASVRTRVGGGRGAFSAPEAALFMAGVVLLVLLVIETGWRRLASDIVMIRWGFVLVCGQEVLAIVASTVGWMYATMPLARRVPFVRLAAFRVAGEAINHLTPTATLGGEFVRARLLAPYLGPGPSTASVTIAKFAETAGQFGFIALGLAVLLPSSERLGDQRWWVVAVVCGVGLGVVLLGWMLSGGFFTFVGGRLSALGIAREWLTRHRDEIAVADALIRDGLHNRPSDLGRAVFWYAMAFAARVLEVWIILRFLGLPATWDMVLPIEAASTLIDAVLFFVPGKIGTQEGGKMVIFLMLGLPPEKGLAMGLIRRGRALFWDVAGLAIYAVVRSRLGARDALTGSGTP